MFRKIYKVCFYIVFVLVLIAVLAASVLCFMYASEMHQPDYIFDGVLTLVAGTILTFVGFAFTGMIIEAAEDLAAIREQVAPKRKKKAQNNVRPAVQQPVRPVQPVQQRPVQPVQQQRPVQPVQPAQPAAVQPAAVQPVQETVVETEKAAVENTVLRDSPLSVSDTQE